MIPLTGLVHVLVYLIVVGLVCGLLWWLIDFCQLPAPFARVAKVLVAVVAVLIVIGVLLGAAGTPLWQ